MDLDVLWKYLQTNVFWIFKASYKLLVMFDELLIEYFTFFEDHSKRYKGEPISTSWLKALKW